MSDNSTVNVPKGSLYLGSTEGDAKPVLYDSSNFTTHGVIVGMTGSGKTGLGIVLLEETLLSGVPALIIDPKGDMGNLLLSFPQLLPTDFMPWISESEAQGDAAAAAVEKAEAWKSGLARSGIEPERIAKLRDSADFTIYTPGSSAGIGLNLIGSLAAPGEGADPETVQDEIEGFASSLLGLVGIDADPLGSREHILLSNIINWSWSQGKNLDLGTLIALVQQPPMRKLGVIDLDVFFPPTDRVKLAMKLNGLAASPAFASWAEGATLDIDAMLKSDGGKPRAAIVSLGHLSEEERQFVVTLLLSKMVTWMRRQQGTSDLRAMVYMDEVFGYVPPIGAPPSKKPILTILKQARAFGVGLVLSTQNPVDIDYKALSNAGTWVIGRLQTENDQKRLLEGMGAADGSVDISAMSKTISSLEKRQFVLHSTKLEKPQVFNTRWAMSYLPGPLTRQQISQLTPDTVRQAVIDKAPVAAVANAGASQTLADNESTVSPQIADTVKVRYLDPAVEYADAVGASATGKRMQAALAVRVEMLFDDTKSKLRHESEWEALITPLDGPVDPDDAIIVDYDDRDLQKAEPEGAVYILPDAKLKNKTYFKSAQTAIKDHLYRNEEIELFVNPDLKVYSRVGETVEEFEARCLNVADQQADKDVEKLRTVLTRKLDRINAAIEKAEDRVRETRFDAFSRQKDQRTNQVLDIAGGVLGGILGGRSTTRSLTTGIRRSQSKSRMIAKAQERVATAENRYQSLIDDREALEEELSEDLLDIQDEWSAKAGSVETMIVGLEKTDISIDEVVLVWIPVE